MATQVHWHEGLFLQPHHLQLMQRGLLGEIQDQRRLSWHYPYGVIESRLFPDELKASRVRFEHLRVIMPSGLQIQVGENADLSSLDIKPALAKCHGTLTVVLGVPLWSTSGANIAPAAPDATETNHLYRLADQRLRDENTGGNEQAIPVRKINARLMIQTAPEETWRDMEVLPLLRFRRAPDRADDVPQEDERFAPPSLVLGGAPPLRRIATELAARLESSRDELANKLARGGLGADARLEALLRLRTLARFAGTLGPLAAAPATTPFELYLLLRELHGELAALTSAAEEFRCSPYVHDDPLPCFMELNGKIRGKLVDKLGKFLQVKFQENSRGHHQAALTDEYLNLPPESEYFLGVKTKTDKAEFVEYFEDPDKFKVMPLSCEGYSEYGVQLTEQTAPELPAEKGWSYFKVSLRESNHWLRLKEVDKAIVIEWNQAECPLPDVEFVLYMTMPEKS
jgi:type VI secretion system ImpJ/VasE family protein